jgi:hypothetical protein
VLIDWSEKLKLEPPSSQTGAKYPKIGLCVAVCIYRGADGLTCETFNGFFEKPINDVPHIYSCLSPRDTSSVCSPKLDAWSFAAGLALLVLCNNIMSLPGCSLVV